MDTHIYSDEQANFCKECLPTIIKAWREDIFLDYGCIDFAFLAKVRRWDVLQKRINYIKKTIWNFSKRDLRGGTRSWTKDLSICSRMLYHWAIPPLPRIMLEIYSI